MGEGGEGEAGVGLEEEVGRVGLEGWEGEEEEGEEGE